MCMKFISEITERKPKFGWKVIEKYCDAFKTPYQGMTIEKGKTYHTEHKKERGIYIFLNRYDAIQFKKWIGVRYERVRFQIAYVRLGNRVWKGNVDGHDGFTDLKLEHFYTTDMIKVLDIEE